MLVAREFDLDTCAQGAWAMYYDVVRECVGIPSDEVVVCGMSLGYADSDAPANRVKSEREPIHVFAKFVEHCPDAAVAPTRGEDNAPL
jgi:nitroreductase